MVKAVGADMVREFKDESIFDNELSDEGPNKKRKQGKKTLDGQRRIRSPEGRKPAYLLTDGIFFLI